MNRHQVRRLVRLAAAIGPQVVCTSEPRDAFNAVYQHAHRRSQVGEINSTEEVVEVG